MSNENKIKVSDLLNVPDPGFTSYTLSCSPTVGVAKTGKPYYMLKFTISRGGSGLSYDVFMKDNDMTALGMLGITFPALPAPVQVTGGTVISNT